MLCERLGSAESEVMSPSPSGPLILEAWDLGFETVLSSAGPPLPLPHAPHIHMHKIRRPVISDAPAMQGERRIA